MPLGLPQPVQSNACKDHVFQQHIFISGSACATKLLRVAEYPVLCSGAAPKPHRPLKLVDAGKELDIDIK